MAIDRTDKGASTPAVFNKRKALQERSAATGAPADMRVLALVEQPADCKTADDFCIEITRLWTTAQEKFLAIGGYLLDAKERLNTDDYKALQARLPFRTSVAYTLTRVAEAVQTGLIPRDDCPRDYQTAYMLVALPGPEFEQAKERRLVHQTTTRQQVQEFKRELQRRAADAGLTVQESRRTLVRKRKSLESAIQKLQAELAQVNAKLGSNEVTTIDGEATDVTLSGGDAVEQAA